MKENQKLKTEVARLTVNSVEMVAKLEKLTNTFETFRQKVKNMNVGEKSFIGNRSPKNEIT